MFFILRAQSSFWTFVCVCVNWCMGQIIVGQIFAMSRAWTRASCFVNRCVTYSTELPETMFWTINLNLTNISFFNLESFYFHLPIIPAGLDSEIMTIAWGSTRKGHQNNKTRHELVIGGRENGFELSTYHYIFFI